MKTQTLKTLLCRKDSCDSGHDHLYLRANVRMQDARAAHLISQARLLDTLKMNNVLSRYRLNHLGYVQLIKLLHTYKYCENESPEIRQSTQTKHVY
jgi:hypothetical protein